jgi:thiamine pyrophosphate-dependent acetolactate synthase large subunit-like protein
MSASVWIGRKPPPDPWHHSRRRGETADPKRNKPGRDLGYTRYDIMAQGLGCHGEYVEQPEDIRPALERAQKKVDEGMVVPVNVKTD